MSEIRNREIRLSGPTPTNVLKNYLYLFITPITDIINISIETITFPQNFKEAHVRRLLK